MGCKIYINQRILEYYNYLSTDDKFLKEIYIKLGKELESSKVITNLNQELLNNIIKYYPSLFYDTRYTFTVSEDYKEMLNKNVDDYISPIIFKNNFPNYLRESIEESNNYIEIKYSGNLQLVKKFEEFKFYGGYKPDLYKIFINSIISNKTKVVKYFVKSNYLLFSPCLHVFLIKSACLSNNYNIFKFIVDGMPKSDKKITDFFDKILKFAIIGGNIEILSYLATYLKLNKTNIINYNCYMPNINFKNIKLDDFDLIDDACTFYIINHCTNSKVGKFLYENFFPEEFKILSGAELIENYVKIHKNNITQRVLDLYDLATSNLKSFEFIITNFEYCESVQKNILSRASEDGNYEIIKCIVNKYNIDNISINIEHFTEKNEESLEYIIDRVIGVSISPIKNWSRCSINNFKIALKLIGGENDFFKELEDSYNNKMYGITLLLLESGAKPSNDFEHKKWDLNITDETDKYFLTSFSNVVKKLIEVLGKSRVKKIYGIDKIDKRFASFYYTKVLMLLGEKHCYKNIETFLKICCKQSLECIISLFDDIKIKYKFILSPRCASKLEIEKIKYLSSKGAGLPKEYNFGILDIHKELFNYLKTNGVEDYFGYFGEIEISEKIRDTFIFKKGEREWYIDYKDINCETLKYFVSRYYKIKIKKYDLRIIKQYISRDVFDYIKKFL